MSPSEARSIAKNYFAVGCAGCLLVALWIAFQTCSEFTGQQQVRQSMKEVSLALLNYHGEHGHFPAATWLHPDGSTRSWRARILKSPEFDGLASTFERNGYSCLAIVGDDAMWAPNGARRRVLDAKDGNYVTAIVMAVGDNGIDWEEPRELVFDGDRLFIQGSPQRPVNLKNCYVATVGGSIHYYQSLPESLAKALCHRSDGRPDLNER